MKILVVCHRFPFPPQRGGKIRPFNVIRHLAARHQVTVCSLVRSDQEAREAQGLAAHCHRHHAVRVSEWLQTLRMILRLPSAVPSSMGYFHSGDLLRLLSRLIVAESFDLVFVHCSSVAPMVARALAHSPTTPAILDFGDMDSQKWLGYRYFKPFPVSWGYWLEGLKLARAERTLAGEFAHCTATTRAEWSHLDSLGAALSTDWFPNGVDAGYFQSSGQACDPLRLCFVGRMDYFPNQQAMQDFCGEVLPRLQASHPGLRLDIVGANPSRAIRQLGQRPGITVTGSVSDVRPFLRDALAMVAPLRIARGTQNKILEAMAMGVPVVTTRLAAGGVDAIPGQHLLVADSVDEQVAAISHLLTDRDHRDALAAAGRARILAHHDWAHSMERLDRIIERVLGQERPSPIVERQAA